MDLNKTVVSTYENSERLLNSVKHQSAETIHKTLTVEQATLQLALDQLEIKENLWQFDPNDLHVICSMQMQEIITFIKTIDELFEKMTMKECGLVYDIDLLKQNVTELEEKNYQQEFCLIDDQTQNRIKAVLKENSDLKELQKSLTSGASNVNITAAYMKKVQQLEEQVSMLTYQNIELEKKAALGNMTDHNRKVKAGEFTPHSITKEKEDEIITLSKRGWSGYEMHMEKVISQSVALKIQKANGCYYTKAVREMLKENYRQSQLNNI